MFGKSFLYYTYSSHVFSLVSGFLSPNLSGNAYASKGFTIGFDSFMLLIFMAAPTESKVAII